MASVLLLTSAFLHAMWNALLKLDNEPRVNSMAVLGIATICATIAVPFHAGVAFADPRALSWAVGAGLCEAGYFITLALALERSALGLAYTVTRGGAMMIVWFFSSLFLGEAVTWVTALGVGLVLAGLVFTSEPHRGGRRAAHSELKWAYLCACFIAGYHFFYGRALALGAAPSALFAFSLWIGLPIYILSSGKAVRKKVGEKLRKRPGLLLFSGMICALSFLIFLSGLANAGAGFAITLRNTSVIFAQVFALFLGERFQGRRWIGATLVAAGAACLVH